MTPLHLAALHNQTATASVLIDAGAPITLKGGVLGSTPLHLACTEGSLDITRKLFDNDKGCGKKVNIHIYYSFAPHRFVKYTRETWGTVSCHTEYPVISVSRKLLSRTPPKRSIANQCELPHVQAANQRRYLLASKNNILSYKLLCRRRHHASEVRHFFSPRSLSDLSWGNVHSLTE
jgi:hypothetical protein